MTPIAPQDRPKVIAMAVILVLVLGFVLKNALSLLGGPKPPAPAPVVPPVAIAQNTAPVPNAPAASGNPTDPTPAPAGRAIETEGPTDPFRRVLPESSAVRQPTLPPAKIGGTGSTPLPGGGNFPDNTGEIPPATIEEPPIRLSGVVIDRDRIAVVSSDSGTELYKVGSQILGLFRVLRITPEEVFFRGPNGTFTLRVGESHSPVVVPKEPEASAPPTGLALPTRNPMRLPLPKFLGG
ncbi:hypothetical protein EON81_25885 [bacterium]|nr:MAG: hypothetical protein EON81_25885 [bacterium]